MSAHEADTVLPPDLLADVRAIADEEGRAPQDVVRDAVAQFVRQRREADAALVAFRASLDEAEAALQRGEGLEGTPENMRRFLEQIEQDGRARLAR